MMQASDKPMQMMQTAIPGHMSATHHQNLLGDNHQSRLFCLYVYFAMVQVVVITEFSLTCNTGAVSDVSGTFSTG